MCGFPTLRDCARNTLSSLVTRVAVTPSSRPPWPGDPRINIQNHKGRAKPYQVRQVLLAIEKLENMRNAD